MFSKRLLTSAIAAPAIILFVLYAPQLIFQYGVALLLLISAWEWARLIGLVDIFMRVCYLMVIVALFVFIPKNMIMHSLFFTLVCWLFIMPAVIFYPRYTGLWSNKCILSMLGVAVFVPFGLSLVWLQGQITEINLAMYLLLLVWAADTGAYISGKLWGKRKLAPMLSPGKTITGVCGGIISGLLVSVIYGVFMNFNGKVWLVWLLLALFTVLVSIVGDLLISVLKRQAGVKDSGKMLPGHGGVLDRVDSLLAGAPIFTFMVIISGVLS